MFFRSDISGTFTQQNQTTAGQGLGEINFDNNLEDDFVPQDIMSQLGGTGTPQMMSSTIVGTPSQGSGIQNQGTASFGGGTTPSTYNQWGTPSGASGAGGTNTQGTNLSGTPAGSLTQGIPGTGTMGGTFTQGTPGMGTTGSSFNQPSGQAGAGFGNGMNYWQGMNPMQGMGTMPGMMYCCPCPMMYGQQMIPMQSQPMPGTQWQTMQPQGTDNFNRQISILPFMLYGLQGNYYDNFEEDYDDLDFDDSIEDDDYNFYDGNEYEYDYNDNDD